MVYADKPQTLDHLEDNIRRVIADIRPQMLEKVIENWTSRLDYIRASRCSPMPEIIFKMNRVSAVDLIYCYPEPNNHQSICSETLGAPVGSSKCPYSLLYTSKIVSNKGVRCGRRCSFASTSPGKAVRNFVPSNVDMRKLT
ncbi:hypothetical protein TNCV_2355931 [Trichonephila clavipes]|nr:hypothetical protein TNCV_2355931 [Trichonephila clavipes]